MQSDAPFTSTPDAPKGLPPVAPPSGKFLAQLFLVPFVIVACLVGFALFIKWFAGSAWTPEEYLQRLDNPNEDVRWRAAETLAQVLLRDDQLASNPKFVLDLADRLRRAWQANQAEEKALVERLRKQSKAANDQGQESLKPGRTHMLYLSACLGNVILPIGAPLLNELAVNREGGDLKAIAQRRWRAVWGLANLGENVKRFDKLSSDRQQAVLAELANAAATAGGERGDWAQRSRQYLEAQPGSRSLHWLGVDKSLTQCAEDPDPFLREISAFALNFWEGTQKENAQLEAVLVKLTADDGHGEEMLTQLRDKADSEDKSEPITRVPGLKIRYNATVALARRGSENVRLGVLAEMLDLKQQQENFRLKQRDGKIVPEEGTVTLTVSTALQAVTELHRRTPSRNLTSVYGAINDLAKSSHTGLRSEALRTQTELGLK